MAEYKLRGIENELTSEVHTWITRDGVSLEMEEVVSDLMEMQEEIQRLHGIDSEHQNGSMSTELGAICDRSGTMTREEIQAALEDTINTAVVNPMMRQINQQREEIERLRGDLDRLKTVATAANIWLFQGRDHERATVACDLNRVLCELAAKAGGDDE